MYIIRYSAYNGRLNKSYMTVQLILITILIVYKQNQVHVHAVHVQCTNVHVLLRVTHFSKE